LPLFCLFPSCKFAGLLFFYLEVAIRHCKSKVIYIPCLSNLTKGQEYDPWYLFYFCFFAFFAHFKYLREELKYLGLLGVIGLIVAILVVLGLIRV